MLTAFGETVVPDEKLKNATVLAASWPGGDEYPSSEGHLFGLDPSIAIYWMLTGSFSTPCRAGRHVNRDPC
jgi:hypothetical protein